MLYEAAGRPAVDGLAHAVGRCWLCGADLRGKGMSYHDFVKSTFTDHDKAQAATSDHICPACVFCAAERSEVLARTVASSPPC